MHCRAACWPVSIDTSTGTFPINVRGRSDDPCSKGIWPEMKIRFPDFRIGT